LRETSKLVGLHVALRWGSQEELYDRPLGLPFLACIIFRIIIGSDRRPETKQAIEGNIDRFRSGRVRVRDRVRVSSPVVKISGVKKLLTS